MAAKTFWKVFGEKRKENTVSFFTTLIINSLAAFSEGLSFGLILLALTSLNGHAISRLEKVSFIPWHQFSSQQLFTGFIIAAILFQVLRSALSYLSQRSISRLSVRCQVAMEKQIYRKIFSLPFSYIHRYKSGDLVEAVQTPGKIFAVLDAVNRLGVSIFNMCALVVLLFVISVPMTTVLLGLFTLIYVTQKIIFRRIATYSTAATKELASFNHYTFQCLNGIKAIFTFNRQHYIHQEVEKKAELVGETSGRLYLINFALGPLNEALGVLTVGICIVLGPLLLVGSQDVILPALLTFVAVAYRLSVRMQAFIAGIGTVIYYSGAFSHLDAFLEQPEPHDASKKRLGFSGLQKGVEFKDVSLRYEGSERYSVSRVCFSLEKGGFLAFVGTSGAGKSSIADLLIGLYEPTEGSIQIDGINRDDLDLGSWKETLGVVSQETFLLNATVEENIRFGCMRSTKEEIKQAARQAHAHEFIERLSLGYQTLLGTNGHSLSGGEKQRIALARALLRKPDLLILDEATSHLDSHSERIIHETFASLYRKKTLVVIAHRLSSVMHADQILVMEEGEVVERGTHNELIALSGRYAHFWGLQQSKEIKEEEYVRN
jgi:subfamily B ATP-binding cassette protein MsbA